MAQRGQLPAHGFQILTRLHGFQKVGTELRCLFARDTFEDTVGQMRQPFGPAKLNREPRVVVGVQRAADEAATPVLKPRTLDHFICPAVRFEACLILQFDSRVIVIGKHLFHLRISF
jgi:hypothetical protein